jgi:ribonuclease VapC
MSKAVFDSSAILALYYNEPGRKKVLQLLNRHEPLISTINLSEVFTKLSEDGLTEDEMLDSFDGLDIQAVDFNERQSIGTAQLRPETKHLGLSLGDRACLALAEEEKAIVVTADKTWAKLRNFKFEVIR